MAATASVYIELGGTCYFFTSNDCTINAKAFHDRCWFVARSLQKGYDTRTAEAMADIWVTKKHYGAIYPQGVEEALRKHAHLAS